MPKVVPVLTSGSGLDPRRPSGTMVVYRVVVRRPRPPRARACQDHARRQDVERFDASATSAIPSAADASPTSTNGPSRPRQASRETPTAQEGPTEVARVEPAGDETQQPGREPEVFPYLRQEQTVAVARRPEGYRRRQETRQGQPSRRARRVLPRFPVYFLAFGVSC